MSSLSNTGGTPLSATRDDHIDLLRGLAILLILVMHAGAMTPGLEGNRLLQILIGRLGCGMQLFFVLSGYLISRSWDGLRGQPNGLGAFAVKRIGKIAPLYFLFLHLYIAIFFWLFHGSASQVPQTNSILPTDLTLANYLVHVFFVQGLVPAWLDTLVDGGWSVVAEVYFYILYPLLLARYCESTQKAFNTYVFTLGFAILLAEFLTGRMERYYGYRNFFAQLPCFMLGVLAFRILQNKACEVVLEQWALPMLAFAVVLAVGMVNGNLSPVGSHNIYGLVFLIILVAFSRLPRREIWISRLAILRIMGQQSYSLFFIHIFLLKLQTYYLVSRLGPGHFWEILGLNLMTSVFGSMMVSAVLIHPIDQYFVRLSSHIAIRILSPTQRERTS